MFCLSLLTEKSPSAAMTRVRLLSAEKAIPEATASMIYPLPNGMQVDSNYPELPKTFYKLA